MFMKDQAVSIEEKKRNNKPKNNNKRRHYSRTYLSLNVKVKRESISRDAKSNAISRDVL